MAKNCHNQTKQFVYILNISDSKLCCHQTDLKKKNQMQVSKRFGTFSLYLFQKLNNVRLYQIPNYVSLPGDHHKVTRSDTLNSIIAQAKFFLIFCSAKPLLGHHTLVWSVTLIMLAFILFWVLTDSRFNCVWHFLLIFVYLTSYINLLLSWPTYPTNITHQAQPQLRVSTLTTAKKKLTNL